MQTSDPQCETADDVAVSLAMLQTKFWELTLSNPLLQADLARLLSQVLTEFPAAAASLAELCAADTGTAADVLRHAHLVLSSNKVPDQNDALPGGRTRQKRKISFIPEDHPPRKTMKQVHCPSSSCMARAYRMLFTFLDVRAKVKASEWSSFHKKLVHEPVTWKLISIDATLAAILLKNHNAYTDRLVRRHRRGSARTSEPWPEPWIPYPATLMTARVLDVHLPPPKEELSTLFQCLQFLHFFKDLESIFISNISSFEACTHFLRYRFGGLLSRFQHVNVAPFAPMASFGIVDPTSSTYALSATLTYTPQTDVVAAMERNRIRTLRSRLAETLVLDADTITVAEAKFLTELQTAYKHRGIFRVIDSDVRFKAIDVNDSYWQEEQKDLF